MSKEVKIEKTKMIISGNINSAEVGDLPSLSLHSLTGSLANERSCSQAASSSKYFPPLCAGNGKERVSMMLF